MQIFKEFSRKQIITGITCIILFLASYLGVLSLYNQEATKGTADFSWGDSGKDHIETAVTVMSVDPVKGELTARLEFMPQGTLSVTDTYKVAKDLKLLVNSSTGKPERGFDKDKIMEPSDITVSLYDGRVTDYPFDKHKALISLQLEDAKNPEEGAPMLANFWGSIPGFNISASQSKESTSDSMDLEVNISRSNTTVIFSVFIMMGMWIVAVIVLLQSLSVLMKGRMVEIGMFTYMGTLIFALPAVRNIQPGIPPIGTFSDFLSFFWAEAFATIALVIVAYCWLTRYGK
jgi:hypothetical protein